MRRYAVIAVVALALAGPAGCGGDDDSDQAVNEATTTTERAVDEESRAAGRAGVASLTSEVRELIVGVAGAARELVADPDADVDEELAEAERRARELAERARGTFGGRQARLGQALGAVNDRVADVAGDLQQAGDSAEAARVVERDLPDITSRLRAIVADRALREDSRRQLEAARERLDGLAREARPPG